jgi:hypothetical protein
MTTKLLKLKSQNSYKTQWEEITTDKSKMIDIIINNPLDCFQIQFPDSGKIIKMIQIGRTPEEKKEAEINRIKAVRFNIIKNYQEHTQILLTKEVKA